MTIKLTITGSITFEVDNAQEAARIIGLDTITIRTIGGKLATFQRASTSDKLEGTVSKPVEDLYANARRALAAVRDRRPRTVYVNVVAKGDEAKLAKALTEEGFEITEAQVRTARMKADAFAHSPVLYKKREFASFAEELARVREEERSENGLLPPTEDLNEWEEAAVSADPKRVGC